MYFEKLGGGDRFPSSYLGNYAPVVQPGVAAGVTSQDKSVGQAVALQSA